jgi:uncharacterized protein (TIGR03437 family)
VRTLLPGLVCLGTCVFLDAQTVKTPAYTETSIIDYATGRPSLLTLNSLAVIHGRNLSYVTRARLDSDFQGGRYPAALPDANVSVKIRGSAVPVEFASPGIVIFVVPSTAGPGRADLQVIRQGVAGPKVSVELRTEMPLIYPAEQDCLLARHAASGEWVETASPAVPGEEVLLYAGGLGRLTPPLRDMQPPMTRLFIEKAATFRVQLNGMEVEPAAVSYVGSLVGFAGIFEVRLRLPLAVGEDPKVTLILGGQESPVPLRLPLRYPPAQLNEPQMR